MVVSVVFNRKFDSKEYHYLMDNDNVKLMDDVLVPVGEYGHIEVATVVAMWDARVNHKHSDPRYLKRVIAPANENAILDQMVAELDAIREKYNKLLSKLK